MTYAYVGIQIYNTGNAGDVFIATFDIPNGATINKMVVYYAELDSTYDLNIELLQLPLFGSTPITMATFADSGVFAGNVYGETTNISTPVVNLALNAYGLQAELPKSANVH